MYADSVQGDDPFEERLNVRQKTLNTDEINKCRINKRALEKLKEYREKLKVEAQVTENDEFQGLVEKKVDNGQGLAFVG